MSKHTPGPWKTVKPMHGHKTKYLCVQVGEDEAYSTLEMLPADAKLVAAAPDLLEALQLAKATIERLNRHNSANGTLDVIRAALSKADGK
jgi:hypothetical protein